ncbi:MAG TPA: hypothetical protein VFE24_04635 [Pirellulales bacterium]|jgi:hypothetical protein|nr:hypothetical protein [Pirellulales bacterium]
MEVVRNIARNRSAAGRRWNARVRRFVPRVWAAALVLAVVLLVGGAARAVSACPFCQAVKPSFAQQRETAAVVVFAEYDQPAGQQQTFRVQKIVKGKEALKGATALTLSVGLGQRPGGLYFLLGEANSEKASAAPAARFDWSALPVNEVSASYFFRAPDLRTPSAQRLKYFAPFLEHRDAAVAEDAFLEFGHAPFDEVAQVGDLLPQKSLRAWLVDPRIPDGRKGFYGLALGLATSAEDRRENGKLLRSLIEEKKSDFRAGFDGLLAGLLYLEGDHALEYLSTRYFQNPQAAVGDVKHAQSAVRFTYEFGKGVSHEKIAAAVQSLLKRPDTAAAAITDLARWNDWTPLAEVAQLYTSSAAQDSDIRTAVVGYLTVCPRAAGAEALSKLRKRDPQGVAAAEQVLALPIGGK